MLAEVGMDASPFAKAAGVSPSTVTRFLRHEDASILSTTTMMKLRAARDRLISERALPPDLKNLTKNAKKRAIIARLLAIPDDEVPALEEAIERLPKR